MNLSQHFVQILILLMELRLSYSVCTPPFIHKQKVEQEITDFISCLFFENREKTDPKKIGRRQGSPKQRYTQPPFSNLSFL